MPTSPRSIGLVTTDRSYVAENDRERARMRALVERLSDDDLRRQVNDEWTVAAALAHVAYWDQRALWLAGKIERGEPFTAAEEEPEPPDWVNDTVRPFLHALEPRSAAVLALRIAEETDARVAALPPETVWPTDESSLLNPFRSGHRAEHLDELEAFLGDSGTSL
jgi:sulfite reductase beta subunit-like hemoprotein